MCKCVWEDLFEQELPLSRHGLSLNAYWWARLWRWGLLGELPSPANLPGVTPPPHPQQQKGSVVQIAATWAGDLLYLCDGSVYVLISGRRTSLAHLLLR